MHRMRSEDRWVETDYGYALMTVNELRDWTLLARIIRDPEASKRFIENIARHDDVYPSGITRESADWIRWSVFVNELAVQRAVNRLNPREDDLANYQKFKIYLNDEYRKLVRQNEKLMFPVGIDMYLTHYEISLKDASVVLATLARFYLLNHLYVKNPNQSYYRLLADYVDKDSLMLLSRIPELLPSHPVFEAGHFSIDKESIRIGHDDHYTIASRLFFKASVRSVVKYEVHFVAQAKAKDLLEASADIVSGHFQFHFSEAVTSKEIDRMEHLILKKASEFEALTGYRLPQARIIEQIHSEYAAREFRVTFEAKDLPAHILASFFVFTSLN